MLFFIQSGESTKKSKRIAIFFALFYGNFGIHKFYLRKYFFGIIYLFFSWTFLPVLFGLGDSAALSQLTDIKFDSLYNRNRQKKIKSKYTSSNKKNNDKDNNSTNKSNSSVVDVNQTHYSTFIPPQRDLLDSNYFVPSWGHTYVYSYNDLNYANSEQKKFYFQYKKKFIEGELLNIKDNTNYAFILFFDLIDEYNTHYDIELLEKQFILLGKSCNKTKRYSESTLIQLLSKRSDSYSRDKLRKMNDLSYMYEIGLSDYDPDANKLGKIYKERLSLKKHEIAKLNKFEFTSNAFTAIEGCCVAVINFYLKIVKELDLEMKKKDTTLVHEIKEFKELIRKAYHIKFKNKWDKYDFDYFNRSSEPDIYKTIFKRAEKAVRIKFEYQRKLSDNFVNQIKIIEEKFEDYIGNELNVVINNLMYNIEQPDISTELILNKKSIARWRIKLDALKQTFSNKEITVASIYVAGI